MLSVSQQEAKGAAPHPAARVCRGKVSALCEQQTGVCSNRCLLFESMLLFANSCPPTFIHRSRGQSTFLCVLYYPHDVGITAHAQVRTLQSNANESNNVIAGSSLVANGD